MSSSSEMQEASSKQDEVLEGSSPLASSSLKPPRSGKISFSVDALLSGTRRSPEAGGPGCLESKRYRDLIIEHHQHPSRELLARLSPQSLAQGSFAAQGRGLAEPRPQLIVAKDFSRTSEPSMKDRLSPTRLNQLRRELLLQQQQQQQQDEERRSVSPMRQREFDERSGDSEACNRSLEGADDHLLDDEQDARSEDLNVMDSDDCAEAEQQQQQQGRDQDKEKSSPVVPQPIHPGVQRPSGPYLTGAGGPGGWSSSGFPHSLASFAWLPPPPHPHNPHGHLYQHGGPTSPNGKAIAFWCWVAIGAKYQCVCWLSRAIRTPDEFSGIKYSA